MRQAILFFWSDQVRFMVRGLGLGLGFSVLFRDSGIRDLRSLLFESLLFFFTLKKKTHSSESSDSSLSSVSSRLRLLSSSVVSPPHTLTVLSVLKAQTP